MYRVITIVLLFFSINIYGQFLPGIKHIEIVSEIEDSMVLLNKPDIDKINKTYFEKEKLDSLNVRNEKMIDLLEQKIVLQDSIIINNQSLLNNEIIINEHLRKDIEDNTTQYEKYLKKENAKKVGWQAATGAAVICIILALVLE